MSNTKNAVIEKADGTMLIDYKGKQITLWNDEYAENPIGGDMTEKEVLLVSWHRRRGSNMGIPNMEAAEQYAYENKMKVLRVRAYEHGDIAFTLTDFDSYPFNDRFDSGWYGVMIVSEEYEPFAASILKTYENWCNGNVYGFSVEGGESVGGFYSKEYAFLAAKESMGETIQYATQRLLDSVWTLAYKFTPGLKEIEIVSYDRENEYGYLYEQLLERVHLVEEEVNGEKRIVTGAYFSEYRAFGAGATTKDKYYKVANPQYVFSYEQKAEESSNA